MSEQSSATQIRSTPISRAAPAGGLPWALLGVVAFSFTVPFTRLAVHGLSPLFIGSGRAVVAAVLAAMALGLTRQRLPRGSQWARLAVVGGGVVAGFPLLTSFALTAVPASHAAVVIALLPAVTAVTAAVRGREHPPRAFWVAAGAGALAALGFAATQASGAGRLGWADLLLFGAVGCAALGYAEGGLLARELGAWQTISWALVLCSPVMACLVGLAAAERAPVATPAEWAAFAYLGAVSMFLGFFAWYRGLGIGPMAKASQAQLVQPVLSLCWATLLLGEPLTLATVTAGLAVVLSAGLAVRTRFTSLPSQPRR